MEKLEKEYLQNQGPIHLVADDQLMGLIALASAERRGVRLFGLGKPDDRGSASAIRLKI